MSTSDVGYLASLLAMCGVRPYRVAGEDISELFLTEILLKRDPASQGFFAAHVWVFEFNPITNMMEQRAVGRDVFNKLKHGT
jgi:hypothetical protein